MQMDIHFIFLSSLTTVWHLCLRSTTGRGNTQFGDLVGVVAYRKMQVCTSSASARASALA